METRSFKTDIKGEGNKLVGYAAVFDQPAKITEGHRSFTERIKPGAFRGIGTHDVIATYNHNPDNLLGRTSSGTLRLQEDDHGLRFELDLPEFATELKELVSRGDIAWASFAFSVNKGGEQWDGNTRTLTDLTVYELGPVAMPAYQATTVGLRDVGMELKKLRVQLLKKML